MNLISVLIGGLIGALGAYVVNWANYKNKVSEENKKYKREKLEKMVLRALDLQDWLLSERDYSFYKAPPPEGTCPINEIEMIASLYAPDIIDASNKLKIVTLRFRAWIATVSAHLTGGRGITDEQSKEFHDLGMKLHFSVQELVKQSAEHLKNV